MTGSFKRYSLIGLMALGLLAGCGNDAGVADSKAMRQSLLSAFKPKPKSPPPSGPTQEQMAQALNATSVPVSILSLESRDAQALFLEIAKNGPYRTFGTSSRQSYVVRGGMITATRGFGGDLMSSETRSLLRLVSNRQNGTAPYIMRFLNGEDQTIEYTYSCKVTAGTTVPVVVGTLNTSGRVMTAACTGNGPEVTNTFIVSPRGTIIGGRQWLGELSQYAMLQPLRV